MEFFLPGDSEIFQKLNDGVVTAGLAEEVAGVGEADLPDH